MHTGQVPMVAILSRLIWAILPPWVHLSTALPTSESAARAVCGLTKREAQFGRMPWVGASQHPKVYKGVMVDRHVCAELLRV